MSMVGYVLGLGDRHPSNLMLDRMSGKIMHIDFGDCFEVAMTREKFPEKIPFRLTRMLINAMEVWTVSCFASFLPFFFFVISFISPSIMNCSNIN
jgi:phosphatidylinositol kinase/protein kinase (PI-3  family)